MECGPGMKRSSKLFAASLAALTLASAPLQSAFAQSLLRDVEIEQFLDDYSLPVFKAAGLPAEEIEILLVGDPSINAFAGGLTMGVHTGLITSADTPAQIQGVIAHEAGHIAGGHTARSDEALSAASRPIILSLVLGAAAIAAGAPEAGIGLFGLGQQVGLADILKYSRGQEASADQAAITYLDRLGRSSGGLIEFFTKLRNFQVITARAANPYLQSHPLANARVTALEERAKASPHFGVVDSPAEIHRLNLIKAKINGFLQDSNVTLRQYPLADRSEPARYARAVAYYRGTEIDKALKEIDQLIAEHDGNPFYHELKGQMLFEFGRVRESIEPHRRSIALAPDKALLRINLGRALLAAEDPALLDEAARELKNALNLEADNSFGWFELARVYGAQGKDSLAHLATAESKFHVGQKGEAAVFARRALPGLPKGSTEWRQAMDIIASVDQFAKPGRRDRAPEEEKKPEPETPRPDRGEVPDPTLR